MKTLINVRRMVMTVMVAVGILFFLGVTLVIALIAKHVDGHAINLVFYFVFLGLGGIEFMLSNLLEKVDRAIARIVKMLRDKDRYTAEIEEELAEMLKKEKFRRMIAQATIIE